MTILFFWLAAVAGRAAPVPIMAEPRHHRVLENAWVRVFDVQVPPGDETLFHVHDHDYVFVTLGRSHVVSERIDGTTTDLALADGETRFTPAPLVHRAKNVGEAPFHNLTIEILKRAGAPPEPALPPMPGHTVIFENAEVRIDRQTLEPGESTGMHSHALKSLGVCVDGGRIEYRDADGASETADLTPGQFSWHDAPRTHTLKNVGTTAFVAIEIEWK